MDDGEMVSGGAMVWLGGACGGGSTRKKWWHMVVGVQVAIGLGQEKVEDGDNLNNKGVPEAQLHNNPLGLKNLLRRFHRIFLDG